MTSLFLKALNLFYETTEIYLNSQHIGNIIFVIYCSSTKVYEIIGANLGSSVSKETRQAGYARTPRRQGIIVPQGELGPPRCLAYTAWIFLLDPHHRRERPSLYLYFYFVWENVVGSIHPTGKAILLKKSVCPGRPEKG